MKLFRIEKDEAMDLYHAEVAVYVNLDHLCRVDEWTKVDAHS